MRRVAALAAVALAVIATGCGRTEPQAQQVPCEAANQRYCDAAAGDLIEVRLAELHPTQPSLGYDEVFYRLGRYTLGAGAADNLLDAWCATNGQQALKSAGTAAALQDPSSFSCEVALGSETPESLVAMKTAVVGPGGQLYLTDGHHTLTSLWEAPGGGPDTRIRVRIAGNLVGEDPGRFWPEMTARGWTWLKDANGNAVSPEELPSTLGLKNFANDRYRGVLYFLRDVGYRQDDSSPAFQEFYWGQWLRSQPEGLQPGDPTPSEMPAYLSLVAEIGAAMVALPADAPIAGGLDAATLGKLDSFGQEAFDALSAPLDAAKPGKLTYSLAYKAGRR
jgi:hypothetical protein